MFRVHVVQFVINGRLGVLTIRITKRYPHWLENYRMYGVLGISVLLVQL